MPQLSDAISFRPVEVAPLGWARKDGRGRGGVERDALLKSVAEVFMVRFVG